MDVKRCSHVLVRADSSHHVNALWCSSLTTTHQQQQAALIYSSTSTPCVFLGINLRKHLIGSPVVNFSKIVLPNIYLFLAITVTTLKTKEPGADDSFSQSVVRSTCSSFFKCCLENSTTKVCFHPNPTIGTLFIYASKKQTGANCYLCGRKGRFWCVVQFNFWKKKQSKVYWVLRDGRGLSHGASISFNAQLSLILLVRFRLRGYHCSHHASQHFTSNWFHLLDVWTARRKSM